MLPKEYFIKKVTYTDGRIPMITEKNWGLFYTKNNKVWLLASADTYMQTVELVNFILDSDKREDMLLPNGETFVRHYKMGWD
jgi:hypothetical protein